MTVPDRLGPAGHPLRRLMADRLRGARSRPLSLRGITMQDVKDFLIA